MKRCSACGEVKPHAEFYRLKRSSDGYQGYCKPCSNQKRNEWARANPEKNKQWNRNGYNRTTPEQRADKKLRQEFGMTLDDYHTMLARQGGGCAACGAPPPATTRLHVDHDHRCCDTRYTCGSCIRGLLCFTCNVALGNVKDSADRLKQLIQYLERSAVC